MATLNVSYDSKTGTVTCPDATVNDGDTITWVPDGTTVTSIASISDPNSSFNPAPAQGVRTNNWTATVAVANTINYTITVNTASVGQKQKTPKVTVNPPMPKPKHEKMHH